MLVNSQLETINQFTQQNLMNAINFFAVLIKEKQQSKKKKKPNQPHQIFLELLNQKISKNKNSRKDANPAKKQTNISNSCTYLKYGIMVRKSPSLLRRGTDIHPGHDPQPVCAAPVPRSRALTPQRCRRRSKNHTMKQITIERPQRDKPQTPPLSNLGFFPPITMKDRNQELFSENEKNHKNKRTI